MLTKKAKKTIKQEKEQSVELYEELESLSEITERIAEMRERAALSAREKDIDHVDRFDRMLGTILDSILGKIEGEPEKLQKSIGAMIEKGQMHQLKNLMVALAIAVEKRELLLGFDETRKSDDRKLKLQVVFKSKDGTQAGVSVEH